MSQYHLEVYEFPFIIFLFLSMGGNLKIHRTQESDRPYRKYRSPTTNTTNSSIC